MNQHKIAIATFKALALSVLALSAQAAEFVTNGNFTSTTNIGSYTGSGGQLGYNINATGWTTDGYNFLFTPTTSSTTSGTTADNGGSAGTYGKLQLWGTRQWFTQRTDQQPERRQLYRCRWRFPSQSDKPDHHRPSCRRQIHPQLLVGGSATVRLQRCQHRELDG